jgi:hypothetical protein
MIVLWIAVGFVIGVVASAVVGFFVLSGDDHESGSEFDDPGLVD